jgi:5'-3' exonuclease
MRVHVVDGTYELYRAHFAKRPGHTVKGRDVKASVGVAFSMLALLDQADEACTHLAVAFDNPIRSFRNDLYDSYKSDEGVPPELRSQFDLAEEVCRALGIVVWTMDRWEADDALATAATRWGGADCEVRIMTPDKDLGQCLRPGVVQVDRMRKKVIDEAAFRERRGIAPASLPDWLALVGDDADGIPGLRGFGEQAASKVLAQFPHLEAIPRDAPGSWGVRGADKLAATLVAEWELALLWRKLATAVTDVPLAQELGDLLWRGPGPDAERVCGELAAADLLERARKLGERRME